MRPWALRLRQKSVMHIMAFSISIGSMLFVTAWAAALPMCRGSMEPQGLKNQKALQYELLGMLDALWDAGRPGSGLPGVPTGNCQGWSACPLFWRLRSKLRFKILVALIPVMRARYIIHVESKSPPRSFDHGSHHVNRLRGARNGCGVRLVLCWSWHQGD